MHRAKAFFFVSLGILALMFAFQLGATSAHSQASARLVDIEWRLADGRAYAVDSQGNIYSGPGNCGPYTLVATLPAGSVPTGIIGGAVGGSMDIFCENGDAYTITGTYPNIGYTFCLNVFGSPVATQRETWGRIKADRR
jgi:hypothetical protein